MIVHLFGCDRVRSMHEGWRETTVLYHKDVKNEDFYLFLQVVEIFLIHIVCCISHKYLQFMYNAEYLDSERK